MLRIGIDLGTTFSCVGWIDDEGQPAIIPNAEGELTTPSVVCFDGRQAWVGRKAVLRKDSHPHDIVELAKRDMGMAEIPGSPGGMATGKYIKDGFYWGPAGMSALILRKLKRDAVRFFRSQGKLDASADESSAEIEAVITVPAYFGSVERDATALAAYAAGLRVTGIINEPTAAALAYGLAGESGGRILVFDLGGGTFDVTILQMEGRAARVLTSRGDNKLGGKDWDALIEKHLYDEFYRANGRELDDHRGFEVQALALDAKLELSALPSTRVKASFDEGDLEVELFREAPNTDELFGDIDLAGGNAFYFNLRASELLRRLEILCAAALEGAQIVGASGRTRSLTWNDIDEVVMTGGACRMPMIAALLERLAGRRLRRLSSGVELDTSVAAGAALYSQRRALVMDVLNKTIGVLVVRRGELIIEPMLRKDDRLPAQTERRFPAAANPYIEVYEVSHDESLRPDENRSRGRVELDNVGAETEVTVRFSADDSGVVKVSARYPPDFEREFELSFGNACTVEEANRLRDRVQQVRMQG